MMKHLFLILGLTLSVSLYSQRNYKEVVLFDVSTITGDTIKPVSIKPDADIPGRLVEIDFSSVDCNTLQVDIGYGLGNDIPFFIDTIPNVTLPITLDKTVYTVDYKGVTYNAVSIDVYPYDGNYLWVKLFDDAGCTSGEIKVRFGK